MSHDNYVILQAFDVVQTYIKVANILYQQKCTHKVIEIIIKLKKCLENTNSPCFDTDMNRYAAPTYLVAGTPGEDLNALLHKMSKKEFWCPMNLFC